VRNSPVPAHARRRWVRASRNVLRQDVRQAVTGAPYAAGPSRPHLNAETADDMPWSASAGLSARTVRAAGVPGAPLRVCDGYPGLLAEVRRYRAGFYVVQDVPGVGYGYPARRAVHGASSAVQPDGMPRAPLVPEHHTRYAGSAFKGHQDTVCMVAWPGASDCPHGRPGMRHESMFWDLFKPLNPCQNVDLFANGGNAVPLYAKRERTYETYMRKISVRSRSYVQMSGIAIRSFLKSAGGRAVED